jgi:O-antigen ligase
MERTETDIQPAAAGLLSSWTSALKLDRERLDAWCERGILGLVLGILIYSPLATGAVRPQDFVVVQWLALALLVVWLARFWINPKHRLYWPLLCWPVVAFIIYAVLRYCWADIEFVARQELIRVLVYSIIFFAVLNNLHRQETTQIVSTVLVFLAMAIAFYALVQFLSGSDRVWNFIKPEQYHKRGSGTFICPNNLAGYLEMLLPLALAYTLTGRLTHLQKVLVGYAALVIFAGIVVTISRGGWISAGITLLVLFVLLFRQRGYRWQILILLAALVAVGAFFLRAERLSQERKTRLAEASAATDFRIRILSPATEIWKDNLVWGVGPAHFDYRFRQYRPPSDQMQGRPDRVHNDYLNTLVDWGLVGGVLVLSVWLLFYFEVFRSWKFVQRAPDDFSARRSNKSTFVLGGALGLFAILLHSFVDFNMHIPANAILAVTLLALVAGHFRFATEKYWHTVRLPLRLIVSVVLMAGLAYFCQQNVLRTREVFWLAKAEASPACSDAQITAYQNAFAAEKKNPETAYNIGECYRLRSWQGLENYKEAANEALLWYARGMKLNQWDPYNFLRYGMCLDWLKDHNGAEPYFKKAYELDHNGFYTLANIGWHYVQTEDWIKAGDFFLKSWEFNHMNNPIASNYMGLIAGKVAEQRSHLQTRKD